MKPDFIIGGAPKCATTTLFDYLAQHPQICASGIKEPHFFASAALGKPVMQGNFSLAEYQDLFADCEPTQLAGEGSTHYLHHAQTVAPLMAELNPKMKLIFCLRDPVDRAYSHFLFRYSTAGPLTLGGVGQYRDFQDFVGDPEMFSMGDYAANIEAFRRYFPEDQIHLIYFEDIVRDLEECLAKTCAWLGIDDDFSFDLSDRSNETVYPTNPNLMPLVDRVVASVYPPWSNEKKRTILNWRKRTFFAADAPKPRLDASDRSAVHELYRPSVERLQSLTGRNLSSWLQPR